VSNASGRFEKETRSQEDDGWDLPEDLPPLRTQVTRESAKTIITRNESPDISFDRSINPYRGCEHGCVYCFARPTHAYLGLSAELDFETKLFSKINATSLLERELAAPGYAAKTIAIGTNTDPYQPVERRERVMRKLLEVLALANHPVAIVTKSALVLRDLDLLAPMGRKGSCQSGFVGNDARSRPRPENGAPREQPRAAARRDPAAGGGQGSNGGHGGANYPGDQ
jgi:DNA repair photolyase